MSDTGNAPRWRVPRWVKLLLGASLALNLAVIGLVGGMMWRLSGSEAPRRAGGAGDFALMAALERDDRRAIFRQMRAEGGPKRGPSTEGKAAMLVLLRADEFDVEAMQVLLTARIKKGGERQAKAQKIWLTHVSGMSVDARRAYADRMENWRPRERKKRGDRERK